VELTEDVPVEVGATSEAVGPALSFEASSRWTCSAGGCAGRRSRCGGGRAPRADRTCMCSGSAARRRAALTSSRAERVARWGISPSTPSCSAGSAGSACVGGAALTPS